MYAQISDINKKLKQTKQILNEISDYIVSKDSALVVGCSYGYEVKVLYDYGFNRVIGIDISKGAIAIAKKVFSDIASSFIVADATHLPFRNNSFDFIYASDVLEHIPNPKTALLEIYRVLKDKGSVFVRVPNSFAIQLYHLFPSKKLWSFLLGHPYECPDPSHISELPAYRWEQFFTEAGFDFIRLKIEPLYIRGSARILHKPMTIKKPFILQYNLHYILIKR